MKILPIVAALACVLTVTAHADGLEAEMGDSFGVSELESSLPENVSGVTGEMSLDGSYDVRGALGRLFEGIIDSARSELHGMLGQTASLAVIALVSAAAESTAFSGKTGETITLAACCACVLISADIIQSGVISAEGAADSLLEYSNTALPAVFLASSASGAIVSAPVKYAAVSLAMDVTITVIHKLCIPLINAYFALCAASAVSGASTVRSIAKTVRWLTVSALTLCVLAFTAFINLSGAIAVSADATAVKTAKTLISTALPVVGGMISDAASTVLSAAGLVKSSAGVFALIAAAALCLGPFVRVLCRMLLYKAVSAFSAGLGGAGTAKVLEDVGSCLSLYAGAIGASGIMLFISICSAIRTVSG